MEHRTKRGRLCFLERGRLVAPRRVRIDDEGDAETETDEEKEPDD